MNEFAIELGERMERLDVSRAKLARLLGTSQAYVTKVLGGNVNFTIETMAKLAMALGGALHLHIADRGVTTRWFDTTGPATFVPEALEDVETHLDDAQTATAQPVSTVWS